MASILPFADRRDEREENHTVGGCVLRYRNRTIATIDLMRALVEFIGEKGLDDEFKRWLAERPLKLFRILEGNDPDRKHTFRGTTNERCDICGAHAMDSRHE